MFVAISVTFENSFCLLSRTTGPHKPCVLGMFCFPFNYWCNNFISSWFFVIQVDGYRHNWKNWAGSFFYLVVMMKQPFVNLDATEWDSLRQQSWSLEESASQGFSCYKRYCCWRTQYLSNGRRSDGKNEQKTYNPVDTMLLFGQ